MNNEVNKYLYDIILIESNENPDRQKDDVGNNRERPNKGKEICPK